jgi:hypothetical protein
MASERGTSRAIGPPEFDQLAMALEDCPLIRKETAFMQRIFASQWAILNGQWPMIPLKNWTMSV